MKTMKSASVFLLFGLIAVITMAERIAPLSLPTSAFADTESSTNIAITAWNVSRSFSVTLSLDAGASNCVEAAVGNVLANGWNGENEDGPAVSPDGLLELICNQISAAGELMHKGGMAH